MKPDPRQHLPEQFTTPHPTGQKKACAPLVSDVSAITVPSSSIRPMRVVAGRAEVRGEAMGPCRQAGRQAQCKCNHLPKSSSNLSSETGNYNLGRTMASSAFLFKPAVGRMSLMLLLAAAIAISSLVAGADAFFCPVGCGAVNCGARKCCGGSGFMSCECYDCAGRKLMQAPDGRKMMGPSF
ncbi:hypothetical protein OEZ85_003740 [Tetradesmus obliquus]|uniref:Invertebrate defensins family profile domain-containing protein n=1 Tax=Tetradesmus obliquus TaxID=3088 RepID=A0ABY8UCA6_TETOB|nr:hypothetical protein OEZ85_003740 [Tetradesmus obliquus]